MESELCLRCGKYVTVGNMTLHQLRCTPGPPFLNASDLQSAPPLPPEPPFSNVSNLPSAPPLPATPDGWDCERCSYHNTVHSRTCEMCDGPSSTEPAQNTGWDCLCCGARDNPLSLNSCMICTSPRTSNTNSSQPQAPPSEDDHDGWNCGRCSFRNVTGVRNCEMCGTPVAPPVGGGMGGSFRLDEEQYAQPAVDEAAFAGASMFAGALGGAALAYFMSQQANNNEVVFPDGSGPRTQGSGNRRDQGAPTASLRSDRQPFDAHTRDPTLSMFDGAMMGAGLGLLLGSAIASSAEFDADDADTPPPR